MPHDASSGPNRHLTRQAVFQAFFEADFRQKDPSEVFDRLADDVGDFIERDFGASLIKIIKDHQDEIDAALLAAAPDWPIEHVARVDKTVLRIGIAELLYGSELGDIPARVAINESVELAKKFGSDSSHRFVNGVLGTVYRSQIEPSNDSD